MAEEININDLVLELPDALDYQDVSDLQDFACQSKAKIASLEIQISNQKQLIEDLQKDLKEEREQLRELADAVLNTKSILENHLYATRVKVAIAELENVEDIAYDWFTEPEGMPG